MKIYIGVVNRYMIGSNTYHDVRMLNMAGDEITNTVKAYGYENQYKVTGAKLINETFGGYADWQAIDRLTIWIVTDIKNSKAKRSIVEY